jgi:hypothetical protein
VNLEAAEVLEETHPDQEVIVALAPHEALVQVVGVVVVLLGAAAVDLLDQEEAEVDGANFKSKSFYNFTFLFVQE